MQVIVKRRKRAKQSSSLVERLDPAAAKTLAAAQALPPGRQRTELLSKAHQHEEARDLAAWLIAPRAQ